MVLFGAMPCFQVLWLRASCSLEMPRLPLLQALSWWETEIEMEVVRRSCPIKLVCGGSIRADLGDLSPPCGRGDEQEDEEDPVLRRFGALWGICVRALLHTPEAATFGVPKRRLQCIVAIQGRWSHSELGSCNPSIFFLQADAPMRRIFGDLGKGSMAGVAPSGKFPGGGVDPRALRSCRRGGEDQGPDCVFIFLSLVFSVKELALSYIPLSFRGFDVTLYPPPV